MKSFRRIHSLFIGMLLLSLLGLSNCEEVKFGFTPSGIYPYMDETHTFVSTDWDTINPPETMLVLIHGAQSQIHSSAEATTEYWTNDFVKAVSGNDQRAGSTRFQQHYVSYYDGTLSYSESSNRAIVQDWWTKNQSEITNNNLPIVLLGSSAGSIMARYLIAMQDELDPPISGRIVMLITVCGLHEGATSMETIDNSDLLQETLDLEFVDQMFPTTNEYTPDYISSLNTGILDPTSYPFPVHAIGGRSSMSGYPIPKDEYNTFFTSMDTFVDFGSPSSSSDLDLFPRMVPGDILDDNDGNGEMDNDGLVEISSSMGLNLRDVKADHKWFSWWVEDSHHSIRQRAKVAEDIYDYIITQRKTVGGAQ